MVYQFCRIGAYSFCAFGCGVYRDVPPYVMAAGYRAEPRGINAEGLRRNHFSPEEINIIRQAYKLIYRSDLRLDEALDKLADLAESYPRIDILRAFLASAERGIIR